MFTNPYNHLDNYPSDRFISYLTAKGINTLSNQLSDSLYTDFVWACQDNAPQHTVEKHKTLTFEEVKKEFASVFGLEELDHKLECIAMDYYAHYDEYFDIDEDGNCYTIDFDTVCCEKLKTRLTVYKLMNPGRNNQPESDELPF